MVKSIRLSESKRDDIVCSVMKAWDQVNKEPVFKSIQLKIANDYYDRSIPKSVRKVLEDKKYNNYVRKGNSFLVQVCGVMENHRLGTDRPIPGQGYEARCLSVFDEKHEDCDKLEDLIRQHGEWRDKRNQLQRETAELLNSVSSTAQLLELWPEIEDLLPAYLADPSKGTKLPSIPVSRLNEKLGLSRKARK